MLERELPEEREALGLVATGGAVEEGRAQATRELDFYDFKGALESAVDAMKLQSLVFSKAEVKHLRAGQAAAVTLSVARRARALVALRLCPSWL